jgi:DNA mismatch repair protein MutS2
VTTHYAALKDWASSRPDAVNAATGFDPETDAPLYSLALGRAGTSHALRIAERLGLDPAVVADARDLAGPEQLRTSELLAEAEAAEREASGRLAELDRSLAAARAREHELERELESVRASRERARAGAVAEAEAELADARAELARLRDEVRAARRHERDRRHEAGAAERERDRALGRATERASRAERAVRRVSPLPAQVAPLAAGDPVEAPELGVRGTIAAIRGTEAEVVGAAGQRVRISLDRLRPTAERLPPPVEAPVQVRAASIGRDASDELDVRGLAAAEARERVRGFADDAALAGLPIVRVVHGRGTGAVRAAVRQELEAHPLVERIEPDANDGATVAYLG